LAVAQHLPQGRHQAGDRHLKIHEDPDTLDLHPAEAISRSIAPPGATVEDDLRDADMHD
jgi:hypothetical protein